MVRFLMRRLWPAALLGVLAGAHAQPAPRPARADPLDPAASVPAPAYSSVFARYRRHAEAAPLAWKEANDTVTRIGGWRAYAREAAAPAAPASAVLPADDKRGAP